MSRTLELNCLVLGDDPIHVFTVKIPDTETVSILKKEIRKEKQNAFKGVDADKLLLWKVSILADDNLQQSIEALNLGESSDQHLRRPVARLFNVFPDLSEDERVHIIVQPPPSSEFQTP